MAVAFQPDVDQERGLQVMKSLIFQLRSTFYQNYLGLNNPKMEYPGMNENCTLHGKSNGTTSWRIFGPMIPISWLKDATHTACTLFWIPERQAISTDNGFIFKKISQNQNIKGKKNPQALLALPASWPGWFSQKGRQLWKGSWDFFFSFHLFS